MIQQQRRRDRGVILTWEGWQKLETAMQDSRLERYTFGALSERTLLDPRTVARIIDRVTGVDKRSIQQFFQAFDLELNPGDCIKSEPRRAECFGNSASRRQDLRAAADLAIFYGCIAQLEQLESWILNERCRLLAILGMGGIGKTAVARKLASQLESKFEYVIWQSLKDEPPLTAILANLIQFLSDGEETATTLPASVSERITRLLDYLRQHRCLVILDGAEVVLSSSREAGSYGLGNQEEYGEFLRRVTEVAHTSCLVLTSREKPKEIAYTEGAALPVRSLLLPGLDVESVQEMFARSGCFCTTQTWEWRKLREYYAGNPLVLQMVAAVVQEVFEGNVSAYLSGGTTLFQEMRELLAVQFEHLSELERQVMYWLAINCSPITLLELRTDILSPVLRRNLPEALKSLLRRSLIQKTGVLFSLSPMMAEYVLEQFMGLVCAEIAMQELDLMRSHTLLKPRGRNDVKQAQVRLILKPMIERLLVGFSSYRHLKQHLNQILLTLQKLALEESGYAEENLLNLLQYLSHDLGSVDTETADIGVEVSGMLSQRRLITGVVSRLLNKNNTIDGRQEQLLNLPYYY